MQNEETKPFAKALQSNVDSASAPFLETLPSDDERLQEDEEDHYEDPQPSQDFFTGGTVKTKTTHNDLRAEAIKRQVSLSPLSVLIIDRSLSTVLLSSSEKSTKHR